MKRILFLLVVCTPLFSFGQSFSFLPSDTLEKNFNSSDYVSEFIKIQNDGDANISLNFVVLSNTIESKGWAMVMCTNVFCYPSVPSSGSLGSIKPGAKGYVNPYVGFNSIVGTGEFIVRIYEAGNPSNADTLVFIFHADNLATVANVGQENVVLYPNPALDQISIKGIGNVATSKVEIRNSLGQVVMLAKHDFSINGGLQVGELPAGHYNVVVYTEKGSQRISSFVKL
jgi:Secretion system C-terminal sorting domain